MMFLTLKGVVSSIMLEIKPSVYVGPLRFECDVLRDSDVLSKVDPLV